MRRLRPTWKSRLRRPLQIRRIEGASMQPSYAHHSLVWASALFHKLHPGDVVIIQHNGLEKIKRIEAVVGDELYVLGDNPVQSTDSRAFGWLSTDVVIGRVIWPRTSL